MGATRPKIEPASSSRLPSAVTNGAIRKPSATTSQSNAIARKAATHIIDLTRELEPTLSSKLSYETVFSASVTHTVPYFGDETSSIGVYDTVEDANKAARTYLDGEYGEGIEWDEYEDDVDKDGCVHINAKGFESETFDVDVEMKKLQKRKPPPPEPRTLPVPSQARATAPKVLKPNSAASTNYEDVYVVSSTYSIPHVSEETNVISLHSDLDEANEVARRYLDDKNPNLPRWDEYSERFNCHEGGIYITAANVDTDSYIVTVRKNRLKRKPQIQQIPPPPSRSPSPELRDIFLVTIEKQRYIYGSNEDRDLENIDITGAFKTLEDADEFAEEQMQDLVADGEWHREDGEGDGEGDGMLVLAAREWGREEMVVVRVSELGLG